MKDSTLKAILRRWGIQSWDLEFVDGGKAILTHIGIRVTLSGRFDFDAPGKISVDGKILSSFLKKGARFLYRDKELYCCNGDVTSRLPVGEPLGYEVASLGLGRANVVMSRSNAEYLTLATSDDETRANLQNVLIDIQNSTAVATDGHRMHMVRGVKCARNNGWVSPMEKYTRREMNCFMVPGWVVEFAAKENEIVAVLADDVDGVRVEFFGGEESLLVRDVSLDRYDYPPYTQVIPKIEDSNVSVRVLVNTLTAVLKTFPKMKNPKITIVGAANATSVEVSVEDDGNKSTANLPVVECTGDFRLGINPKYLLDAISAFKGKEVTLYFENALHDLEVKGPVLIVGCLNENESAVVMPINLR